MFIHEMTEAECHTELERARYGRLACARDGQPYVVPIYFSYAGRQLYGFSTIGRKIEWMRANPLVCVEIDERISHSRWTSVIVYGRYEELPDAPEFESARMQAHQLLQQRAMWWEPAHVAKDHAEHAAAFPPIFYRIHVSTMTGYRATPDRAGAPATATKGPTAEERWFGNILHLWNRTHTFLIFEAQKTATDTLVKLPRTDETDALLNNSGLAFTYDRFRGRYVVRVREDDIEKCSSLLTELMRQTQPAGGR